MFLNPSSHEPVSITIYCLLEILLHVCFCAYVALSWIVAHRHAPSLSPTSRITPAPFICARIQLQAVSHFLYATSPTSSDYTNILVKPAMWLSEFSVLAVAILFPGTILTACKYELPRDASGLPKPILNPPVTNLDEYLVRELPAYSHQVVNWTGGQINFVCKDRFVYEGYNVEDIEMFHVKYDDVRCFSIIKCQS
jgi:hypothetical protein